MNASDRLADLYTIRQLLLRRVASDQTNRVVQQIDDLVAELEKQIKTGKELTEVKGKRLDQAIEDLMSMVSLSAPNLTELSILEAEFVSASLAIIELDAAIPAASILEKIARAALIQGATMAQWFAKLNEQTRFDIERAVKLGVSLGETNAQIAKRIVGNGSDKGPEPIAKTRRDAMAITRTAVQTVSNDARMATYDENADLIKGLQWVSTLDSRTSDICIARAGKVWTFPDMEPEGHRIPWNGGPPAHWSCRSTVIPVLKTWQDMGIDMKELTPSTRSSMDGQVAADMTFEQFLESKPPEFADEMLGKGRAELWRSGKITFSQLLNQQGNPLTLKQLRSRYGG